MDVEKARHLLERLRARTETRGATAAEAEAAANLAAKIIERFGLQEENLEFVSTYRLSEKRREIWIMVLLQCVESKFKIKIFYCREIGQSMEIEFQGPEHVVRVARWLFLALYIDIRKRSWVAGKALGRKGSMLTKFRREFSEGAVVAIHDRMRTAQQPQLVEESPDSKSKSGCKARRSSLDFQAIKYGRQFGREVSLDTNAVGQAQFKLEHQRC